MQLPDQRDQHITSLAKRMRGLAREIVQGLTPEDASAVLNPSEDIFAGQPGTRLFLIKSGQLRCQQERKLVYIAEAGDLVGLSRSLQLPEGPFSNSETVELVPYCRDALVNHVNSSETLQKHWAFFLICRSTFFSECLARETKSQLNPATGFLHFDTGDIIINQGDQADCVYTLLEGSADVFHNEVKVGEVKAEEIFGAMAVFTRQPRSATVKATSSCSVLAVKKDEFLDLVSHQPRVCLSLIEEMADKINQLNHQVLELQR